MDQPPALTRLRQQIQHYEDQVDDGVVATAVSGRRRGHADGSAPMPTVWARSAVTRKIRAPIAFARQADEHHSRP